jgi:hypothetical protein
MTTVVHVVNVIPNSHSNESNQDSEPSIAVNPSDAAQIVITAFTPPDAGQTDGPIYYSADGGNTWQLNFGVAGGEPGDQSVAFATGANELFGAMIRGDTGKDNVFRTPDPTASGGFPTFDSRPNVDQPWVESRAVIGGPDDGKVRVYLGYNNDTGTGVGTASVDVCLDALASTPTFNQVSLDPRPVGAGLRDGYAIRPVAHPDGTIYVLYEGWRSGSFGANITTDIVVARDDDWAKGGSPFTVLVDPSDHLPGRLVATGVVINDGGFLGQERLNNDLAIAVDPTNSDIVYVAWADNAGPNYTLRVRRSINRGVDWSGDLLTADNATMTSMAINGLGQVGLMYQQVNAGNWETHFRRTTDGTGTTWDDTTLSVTPDNAPAKQFDPYLGDWARLVAVGPQFYGAFCANNTPNTANFPSGVTFQRNHTTTAPFQLLDINNALPIGVSIDPFFYRIGEATLTVTTQRNTFGKDEIDALLLLANPTPPQTNPAVIEQAFFIYVDGFRADELGITNATLSGIPDIAPTITFNPGLTAPPPGGSRAPATACGVDGGVLIDAPQRFTWTYSLQFYDDSDFTQEVRQVALSAAITSTGGVQVSGQGLIILTTQPDPYLIHGTTSWLSVDVQVFNLPQDQSLPSTPTIQVSNPNNFIHALLQAYNNPALPRAPNHPFDVDLVANEDTSAVELAGAINVGSMSTPVYNFAVARVRYRALTTPAPNVRAFFRMFQASTTSTNFDPTSTYLTGGQGGAKIPLLGVVNNETVSIPFFAAARISDPTTQSMDEQTDPDNVGPLGQPIPPDSTGAEVQVYFGCWLDINQTTNVLPQNTNTASGPFPSGSLTSIQDIIRGQHQCLVAEINLDPPEPQIIAGTSTANTDKLAQRNLTIIPAASPHQIPVTFDIKRTAASLPPSLPPDEMMLDWNDLPAGSAAKVYLPGTPADAIIAMANQRYFSHGWSRIDSHTVACKASGVSYLPIPPGIGSNYAGLLTVDLPPTVKRGQTFSVVAHQITNTSGRLPPPPPPTPQIALAASPRAARPAAVARDVIEWRRVLGSFQVSIPVRTRHALLEPEERLLSVLRWIARSIPHGNRWRPVFERYLGQIAGRVTALGGDPGAIIASPTGDGRKHHPPPKHGHEHERHYRHTGKIAGLLFDRFGDFEGFILDTEDGDRSFYSRERDMRDLAERGWKERLRITVFADWDERHRVRSIVVHQPPERF